MELLCFYKIEESQHDTLLSQMQLLPVSFQEKLQTFKRWQDCQLSLMGHVLLSIGLQETGLTSYRWQNIRYTGSGKPYLDGRLHFSITHSGEFAACMISTARVIGIDLEMHRPIDISEFHNVFTTQELDVLQKTTDELACFYDYWVLKEAVIKAIGSGLEISLSSLDVSGRTSCQVDGRRWFLNQPYSLPGYSFAVAADKPALRSTPVRHVTFQEALQAMGTMHD